MTYLNELREINIRIINHHLFKKFNIKNSIFFLNHKANALISNKFIYQVEILLFFLVGKEDLLKIF